MKVYPVITEDGSYTLHSQNFDVSYHSIYGAVEESILVFISAGLQRLLLNGYKTISILEIGFGTGLNALLSSITAKQHPDVHFNYTAYEAYPISLDIAKSLSYCQYLHCTELQNEFESYHQTNTPEIMSFDRFKLEIIYQKFESISDINKFNLVYYDAFAPTTQKELWGEEMMQIMYRAMKPDGILTSYCAKGSFKRALKAAGFEIESLPGPARKREMTRAWKR